MALLYQISDHLIYLLEVDTIKKAATIGQMGVTMEFDKFLKDCTRSEREQARGILVDPSCRLGIAVVAHGSPKGLVVEGDLITNIHVLKSDSIIGYSLTAPADTFLKTFSGANREMFERVWTASTSPSSSPGSVACYINRAVLRRERFVGNGPTETVKTIVYGVNYAFDNPLCGLVKVTIFDDDARVKFFSGDIFHSERPVFNPQLQEWEGILKSSRIARATLAASLVRETPLEPN